MPLLTLIAACTIAAQQDTKVYEDKDLDLRFSYPAAWRLRKERLYDVLEFQVQNQPVRVQIIRSDMSQTKENWQNIMLQINSQSGRQVIRQWEEELLGVPLLLTRYQEGKAENTRVVLAGLLLSVLPYKLNFRLISPPPVAETAEEQWHSVLLSISTVSGRMPDEKRPTVNKPKNDEDDTEGKLNADPRTGTKTYILKPEDQAPPKAVIAPVRVTADQSRGIYAYFPQGWQLDQGVASGPGGTTVSFAAMTGDRDQVKREYLRQSGLSLTRMTTVTKREEDKPGYNAAAFLVSVIRRQGSTTDGELVSWTAYGWANGYGWVASWTGSPADFDAAKQNLASLAGQVSISAQ